MSHQFWLSSHSFLVGEKGRLQHFVLESFDIERQVNGIPGASIALSFHHGGVRDHWQKTSEEVTLCKPGQHIAISISPDTAKGEVTLFQGVVTEQSVSAGHASTTLHLRASHLLHRLTDGPRYHVHTGSEKEALTRLLTATGLSDVAIGALAELDTSADNDERLIQWACSDWQWLRTRLHAHGAWLLPSVKGVKCVRPDLQRALSEGPQHKVSAADGEAILHCAWTFSNEGQPASEDGIAVRYWKEDEQALSDNVFGRAVGIGSGALDGRKVVTKWPAMSGKPDPWMLRHSANHFVKDAQAEADARLLARHASAVGLRVKLLASIHTIAFNVGDALCVEGFGSALDGQGIITSIRHWWAKGVFETTVTIGLDGAGGVDAPLVPGASGLTIGIVAQSQRKEARSDHHRVLVNVPLLDCSLWARHAVPYASDGVGIRLPLEVGDEVVLAFLDEDPRYPVILGATHSQTRPAPTGDAATLTFAGDRDFVIGTEAGTVSIFASKIKLEKSEKGSH